MNLERIIGILRLSLASEDAGLHRLARMIDLSDSFTWGHSERVGQYAAALGRALELPDETVGLLRKAGLLHDLGKLALDEDLGSDPRQRSSAERDRFEKHPVHAADLLGVFSETEALVKYVKHVHERVDGKGFPDGLTGTEIPEESRILAVVNEYDKLVSARAYRPPLSIDDALGQIRRGVGSKFDQLIVATFVHMVTDRNMLRAARMGAASMLVDLSLRDHEKAVRYFVRKHGGTSANGIADLLRMEYPELGREQALKIVLAVTAPEDLEEDLYSDDVEEIKEGEVVVYHPARIDADVGSVLFFRNELWSLSGIFPHEDDRFRYLLKR